MKKKFMKILKESYYNLSPKDEEIFNEIMQDDGLGKCKPKFNLWAFIFGWFYLLYRRMAIEAMAVLVVSLMVGYLMAYAKLHPLLVLAVIILTSSLLSGFCYYFLYLNKLGRDIDYCGEFNTDIECMKKRAKPKITYVIIAVLIILILIWPWIYAIVTGVSLKT
ncbi:MAG: DUF2628 domain-containing protein [Nautiliaceae bacterium]